MSGPRSGDPKLLSEPKPELGRLNKSLGLLLFESELSFPESSELGSLPSLSHPMPAASQLKSCGDCGVVGPSASCAGDGSSTVISILADAV